MQQDNSHLHNGKSAKPKAWNPRTIGLFALFLTVLPAGIVYIINMGRLGQKNRQGMAIIALTATVVTCLLMLMIMYESISYWATLILNTGMSAVMYFSQREAYQRFLASGGKKAEFLIPSVYLFGSIIVVFSILVVYETGGDREYVHVDTASEWSIPETEPVLDSITGTVTEIGHCDSVKFVDLHRIPCGGPLHSVEIRGHTLFAHLLNGTIEVYDTLGREIATCNLSLSTPSYSHMYHSDYGWDPDPHDEFWAFPASDRIVVARHKSHFYPDGRLGHLWESLRRQVQNAFGFGSVIEVYEMSTMKRLCTQELSGDCHEACLDAEEDHIAFVADIDGFRTLKVLQLGSGTEVYSEVLPYGVGLVLAWEEKLRLAAVHYEDNALVATYDFDANNELTKERVDTLIPVAPEPSTFYYSTESGDRATYLDCGENASCGPVSILGNTEVYLQCSLREVAYSDDTWCYWNYSPYDRELLILSEDTLFVGDFGNGTFEAYLRSVPEGVDGQHAMIPVSGDKFITAGNPNEILIFTYEVIPN